MATIQTDDEIRDILVRLEGEAIATLQVLGINSLKTLSPTPEALAGEVIILASRAMGRGPLGDGRISFVLQYGEKSINSYFVFIIIGMNSYQYYFE